ncbi:BTB/POZ domain-containing protein 2-like [Bradysia coprophila]|uniref:BTB/POZ domain-containing protein 2-like n=1 Tax=Bradysia coprophila TaxID=38358 RepID=UPI00187D9F1A|nr:BTB/POZ domain-containing protein 2-like [Bradysia coprophila]
MDVDNSTDLDLTLDTRKYLLYNANESDVKFMFNVVSTGDSSSFEVFIYAHKRILSIGSCVFSKMFNGLMAASSSSSDNTIYITDIPIECFRNILKFIYIGVVEFNMGNIVEVMYAAHKYQICKLETMCCEFLYENLQISNVLEIYELTIMFNNDITKRCLQWIDDLFADLVKWNSFMMLKKPTLMDLLKRDTLNIRELDLFKSVYKWAENYCTEASTEPNDENLRKAADNFTHIRFPTMNFNEFAECTRYGLNILTSDEKIDVWDALSKVQPSTRFNSKFRIRSATAFRTFVFPNAGAVYCENGRYSFEFHVSRMVFLNYISVIRNCSVKIYEKDSGETHYAKGKECAIQVNRKQYLPYTFVPHVSYAIVTVEHFQSHHKAQSNPGHFKSYTEMHRYFNSVSKMSYCSFDEHNPFVFQVPQYSLIKMISFHTSKFK